MPDRVRRRTRKPQRLTVDRAVADLNFAHFKKLLAVGTDPVKRKTIECLLIEEEAKLAWAPADNAGARKEA
jgi:hypothetical protein